MRSEMRRILVAAGCILWLAACGGQKAVETKKAEPAKLEKPPEVYKVKFETTKGDFLVEVRREWAPRGADHFFNLVQARFYDGARFFRVVRGFVAQFGIAASPKVQQFWGSVAIPDDPVRAKNTKGSITFARLGPNSRRTQVFINLRDNTALDKDGFAPFGRVVEGMDIVEKLYFAYGEIKPRGGGGPDPTQIELQGNAYLERQFPRLDAIHRAAVIR